VQKGIAPLDIGREIWKWYMFSCIFEDHVEAVTKIDEQGVS